MRVNKICNSQQQEESKSESIAYDSFGGGEVEKKV
jgi:hypothetical protein